MAQSSAAAAATRKPNYNKHFPSSFLLNYGRALENMSDDKILSRLRNFNCEWMSRPNIAMSEMASTFKDNLDTLQRFRATVFTPAFVDEMVEFVEPIMGPLQRLDNKDRSTHEQPTQEDVLTVLETIHEHQKVEDLMVAAFTATGPVLMIAIHALAINTLLHNPSEFAKETLRCPATEEFKDNPTDDTMMQYLLSSILMRRRSVQRSRSLFDRSRYEQEDQGTPSSSQDRPSRASQRLDRGNSSPWQRPVSTTPTPRSRLRTAATSTTTRPTSTPGRRTSATSTSRSLPSFNVSSIDADPSIEEEECSQDRVPASAPSRRQQRPWQPASERFRLRVTGEAEMDDDEEEEEEAEVAEVTPPPPRRSLSPVLLLALVRKRHLNVAFGLTSIDFSH